MSWQVGDRVIFIPEMKVYEFGYYTKMGAVIYNPGERNMQDSFAVELKDLAPVDMKVKNVLGGSK